MNSGIILLVKKYLQSFVRRRISFVWKLFENFSKGEIDLGIHYNHLIIEKIVEIIYNFLFKEHWEEENEKESKIL